MWPEDDRKQPAANCGDDQAHEDDHHHIMTRRESVTLWRETTVEPLVAPRHTRPPSFDGGDGMETNRCLVLESRHVEQLELLSQFGCDIPPSTLVLQNTADILY